MTTTQTETPVYESYKHIPIEIRRMLHNDHEKLFRDWVGSYILSSIPKTYVGKLRVSYYDANMVEIYKSDGVNTIPYIFSSFDRAFANSNTSFIRVIDGSDNNKLLCEIDVSKKHVTLFEINTYCKLRPHVFKQTMEAVGDKTYIQFYDVNHVAVGVTLAEIPKVYEHVIAYMEHKYNKPKPSVSESSVAVSPVTTPTVTTTPVTTIPVTTSSDTNAQPCCNCNHTQTSTVPVANETKLEPTVADSALVRILGDLPSTSFPKEYNDTVQVLAYRTLTAEKPFLRSSKVGYIPYMHTEIIKYFNEPANGCALIRIVDTADNNFCICEIDVQNQKVTFFGTDFVPELRLIPTDCIVKVRQDMISNYSEFFDISSETIAKYGGTLLGPKLTVIKYVIDYMANKYVVTKPEPSTPVVQISTTNEIQEPSKDYYSAKLRNEYKQLRVTVINGLFEAINKSNEFLNHAVARRVWEVVREIQKSPVTGRITESQENSLDVKRNHELQRAIIEKGLISFDQLINQFDSDSENDDDDDDSNTICWDDTHILMINTIVEALQSFDY